MKYFLTALLGTAGILEYINYGTRQMKEQLLRQELELKLRHKEYKLLERDINFMRQESKFRQKVYDLELKQQTEVFKSLEKLIKALDKYTPMDKFEIESPLKDNNPTGPKAPEEPK